MASTAAAGASGLGEIHRQGRGGDLPGGEMRNGRVELILLARGQHQGGAEFAERFGNLKAQPARAAGDQRHAAREVEQLSQRIHAQGAVVVGFIVLVTPEQAHTYIGARAVLRRQGPAPEAKLPPAPSTRSITGRGRHRPASQVFPSLPSCRD